VSADVSEQINSYDVMGPEDMIPSNAFALGASLTKIEAFVIFGRRIGTRMVCYPSCAVLPKPNKCEAHPPKGLGNPFYDETGYSGNGPGRNNPDAQDEPYQGPIPQGGWRMTGDWYNKKPGPGRNIMNLNPLPGNACFDTDRDCNTFRMYGDNATGTASEGCIILPPNRINTPLDDTIWVEP
jgi:hypothetical protein